MKAKLLGAGLVLAVALLPGRAAAQGGDDDILSKIINLPPPAANRVDGAKGSVRNDPLVQGGKALRVSVPGKGAKSWDVAVANPIQKAVKAGDRIVLAFWARLEKGEGGSTTATLPYNAVQLASAPYTALFTQPVTIGAEWKLHEVSGKADKDYGAGALNVSIHLATGKQTVDLGPIFVLNIGP
jgi:hypothetical protein